MKYNPVYVNVSTFHSECNKNSQNLHDVIYGRAVVLVCAVARIESRYMLLRTIEMRSAHLYSSKLSDERARFELGRFRTV